MNWLDVLMFSTPVALAAIGESINQRAGTMNIGLEGSMLAGAYFGMLVTKGTGSPWLGMSVGVAIGLLLSALQGLAILQMLADQVVVGMATNLLALGVTGSMFRQEFGQSGQLLSVPRLAPVLGSDPVALMVLPLALVATLLLMRSQWGLALRGCGEYPDAVLAAGYSPAMFRWQGLLLSGAFAGAAGAYLAVGIAGSFAENMSSGRGFVALAMVTFGRWAPIWVAAASLLVGSAENMQYVLQARGWNIPHQVLVAAPYLLALAVLIVTGKGALAPRSLGLPWSATK